MAYPEYLKQWYALYSRYPALFLIVVILCIMRSQIIPTVYPKKYAHGFCFAVLCCGYTLTDFPISIRLTSLALWQSNDCPSASKATLMYMDKYVMWIHYERLHNHNKAKHNKTVCIFLGLYCIMNQEPMSCMHRWTHRCMHTTATIWMFQLYNHTIYTIWYMKGIDMYIFLRWPGPLFT